MKINSKITALTMNLTLLSAYNLHATYNDDFEEEFRARIDSVEKNIEAVQKNMQSSLKEFHNQMMQELDNRSNNFTSYVPLQNIAGSQNSIRSYQQSSSSLSFANNDKAIKIAEQKDNQSTTYVIKVTNKQADESIIPASGNQKSDIQSELQDLESYIKKNFRSKPAEKILEECINTMTHDHKDRLINIASSTNGNEKKYTIEISHKKEEPIDEPATKKSRKNKNR